MGGLWGGQPISGGMGKHSGGVAANGTPDSPQMLNAPTDVTRLEVWDI